MNSSNTNPSNCCISTTVSDDESSFPDVDDNDNSNNSIGNDNGFPWQSRSRELEFPVEASHTNFLTASYPPSGLMYQEQGPIPTEFYPSLYSSLYPSSTSEPQPSSSTSLGSFSQEQHYASAPEMYPNCTYHMSGFIPANDIPNMAQPQQPEPSTSDDRDGNEDDNFGDPGFAWRMEPNTKKVSRRRCAASSSGEKPQKQIRTQAQRDANNVRERNRVVLYQKVIKQLREAVNAPENTTIIETLMLAIQRITKLKAEFGESQQTTVDQMTVTVPLATEFHTTQGLYNLPQLSHDCTNDSICKDSVLLDIDV